jgi:hypothetical protein
MKENDDFIIYNPIAHKYLQDLKPLTFSTLLLIFPENVEIVRKVRDEFSIDLPINLEQREPYLEEKGAYANEYIFEIVKYASKFITETDYWKKFVGEKLKFKIPQDFKLPKNLHKLKPRKHRPNFLLELIKIISTYSVFGLNFPLDSYFTSKRINDSFTFESVYKLLVNFAGANMSNKEIIQLYEMQTKVEKSRKYNDKYIARDTYYLQIKEWYPDYTYSQIAEYLWEEYPEIYGFKDYKDFKNQILTPAYEKNLIKFSKNIERSINRLKLWIIDICDN